MAERRKLPPVPMETLPCGCRFGSAIVDGEKSLLVEACSESCDYYQYALDEAARQTKPVEKAEWAPGAKRPRLN